MIGTMHACLQQAYVLEICWHVRIFRARVYACRALLVYSWVRKYQYVCMISRHVGNVHAGKITIKQMTHSKPNNRHDARLNQHVPETLHPSILHAYYLWYECMYSVFTNTWMRVSIFTNTWSRALVVLNINIHHEAHRTSWELTASLQLDAGGLSPESSSSVPSMGLCLIDASMWSVSPSPLTPMVKRLTQSHLDRVYSGYSCCCWISLRRDLNTSSRYLTAPVCDTQWKVKGEDCSR